MLKIRRPLGRLIFNMGIAIPGKTVFLIETAPSNLTWTWIFFLTQQCPWLTRVVVYKKSVWIMFDKCNAATVGYVSVKHIILVNILRFRYCRWQWITTYPVNASPVLQTNYVRSFTYQTRLVDDVLKRFKFNPTLKSGQTSLHRYQWILTFIYFHIATDLFILSGTKWGRN